MKKNRLRLLLAVFFLLWSTAFFELPVFAAECDHVYVEKEEPGTCTDPGMAYQECTLCGKQKDFRNTDPLGHSYGNWEAVTQPSCVKDGMERQICARCGRENTREIPESGHQYQKTVVEPDCDTQGYTRMTCDSCGDSYKTDYTDALGHDYQQTLVAATCTKGGYTQNLCSLCGDSVKTDQTDALGHSYQESVTQPTCTKQGYTLRTCTACGETMKTDYVDALEHQYDVSVVEATCGKQGYTLRTCTACGETMKTDYVDALEHHYDVSTIEATCGKQGYTLHTCTVCGETMKTDYVDAIGHSFESSTVEPTCTKDGYTRLVCTVCLTEERTNYTAATGHDYASELILPTCTKDGYTLDTCTLCGDQVKYEPTSKTGHHYDQGAVTKEPTSTAMGRITYTCQGCGDTYTETIPKLVNPFADVKKSAWYFNAVLWAVDRGITSGTDETHFSPDAYCTREQVITFLWRAMGAPEPEGTEGTFVDVPADCYYRKAVLWAAEQGITTGIDETHFGTGRYCTRAQVVTFLYKAKGSPAIAASDRFVDVSERDYFYYSVLWASENGITSGVDGEHFGPHLVCTRAQIVTFLYKADQVS